MEARGGLLTALGADSRVSRTDANATVRRKGLKVEVGEKLELEV